MSPFINDKAIALLKAMIRYENNPVAEVADINSCRAACIWAICKGWTVEFEDTLTVLREQGYVERVNG